MNPFCRFGERCMLRAASLLQKRECKDNVRRRTSVWSEKIIINDYMLRSTKTLKADNEGSREKHRRQDEREDNKKADLRLFWGGSLFIPTTQFLPLRSYHWPALKSDMGSLFGLIAVLHYWLSCRSISKR
jgi:hypothetical protein